MCSLLPWNPTSHPSMINSLSLIQSACPSLNSHPCPDLRQGLQSSRVLSLFFLAHTGTHSLNTKMKMLRFTGLPFMKTSFESDPFKDEAAQRVTVCFFPRLLQCSLHAWQLLGMLFLAALQPTKTSIQRSYIQVPMLPMLRITLLE